MKSNKEWPTKKTRQQLKRKRLEKKKKRNKSKNQRKRKRRKRNMSSISERMSFLRKPNTLSHGGPRKEELYSS